MSNRLDLVTLVLPGADVRLEPLTLAHAEGLFDAAGNGDVWKYIPPPFGGAKDLVGMRELILKALAAQDAGTELPFVIVIASSGAPIGSTRYMDIQTGHRSLEIGATWIGPRWQRSEVNTACKYMLLRHAFETIWRDDPALPLGAVRVQLKCDARNVRSQAAILRIGATFEGVLRRHRVLPDGFLRDTAYFSILSSEWPSVKQRLEGMLERSSSRAT